MCPSLFGGSQLYYGINWKDAQVMMLEGILPREGRTGALTKPGTKDPVVRGWRWRYSQH